MSRLTLINRRSLSTIMLGLAALVIPGMVRAQSTTPPKVFYACYVPSSGTTYRIKEVDLKQECSKSTHVQFSWTDGKATAVSEFFTVESAPHTVGPQSQSFVVQSCPTGSQLVSGGHRSVVKGSPTVPFVARSSPSDDGKGWGVLMANPGDGTVIFGVFVRCAR